MTTIFFLLARLTISWNVSSESAFYNEFTSIILIWNFKLSIFESELFKIAKV